MLAGYDGLLVPGGFGERGIEGKVQAIRFARQREMPFFGICLGMQLMAQSSEEGEGDGLGWFKGRVVRLLNSGTDNLKIPHMGWNFIKLKRQSKLFEGLETDGRFYHVHSYHLLVEDLSDIVCYTHYGTDIVTGIEKKNIFGVQFHPEKSHMFGMRLLKNFLNL